MSDFHYSEKPETYTHDELLLVKECVELPVLSEKLDLLVSALSDKKDRSAIFFMPKSTFDIFSAFQKNAALCQVQIQDVQDMVQSLDASENSEHKIRLQKKLKILLDYMNLGNSVVPTVVNTEALRA